MAWNTWDGLGIWKTPKSVELWKFHPMQTTGDFGPPGPRDHIFFLTLPSHCSLLAYAWYPAAPPVTPPAAAPTEAPTAKPAVI